MVTTGSLFADDMVLYQYIYVDACVIRKHSTRIFHFRTAVLAARDPSDCLFVTYSFGAVHFLGGNAS